MTRYEYKVIPAPAKGRKAPGVKGAESRFSFGLQEVLNELGAEGWEYQRSDLLPSEERQGLTSSHTVYRSVLVFRRTLSAEPSAVQPDTPLAVPEESIDKLPVEPDNDVAEITGAAVNDADDTAETVPENRT